MNKYIFGAIGLSGLLLLGSAPAVLLAHESHDHGDRRSGYSEREDSRRYEPQRGDDRGDDAYDDDEEDDTDRPSARRYPPPEREQSSPHEQRGRPR